MLDTYPTHRRSRFDLVEILSRCVGAAVAMAVAFGALGCASVSTQVVRLDPALKLPSSTNVEILFEKPRRPYREVALLESSGMVGDGEVALLEDAREKAKALGADAIVRLEVEKTIHPPVVVYDPFFMPFYSRYPLYHYPPYFAEYRVIPGGTVYTLKTLAIKYEAAKQH